MSDPKQPKSEVTDSCKECPYSDPQYVEEIDGYICEGLLRYGDCYMARHETEEW